MRDRLVEIEENYGSAAGPYGYVMRHDVTWLIAEVKRLRAALRERDAMETTDAPVYATTALIPKPPR